LENFELEGSEGGSRKWDISITKEIRECRTKTPTYERQENVIWKEKFLNVKWLNIL
jgi:hypothetical protein